MALKENYKDDILDVSVNTKRKYRMTENPDGTVSFEDETVYTQEGDSFGASDMNATNGKVNALEGDIDNINDNLSKTMVKLWENTSPSSNFVAQDIPLDLSNYRMIKIICNHSKATYIRSISADVMVGDSMYLTKVMPESTTLKMYCMQRTVVTSSSQVSFGDCLFATTTSASITSNDRMIPYQIYGVI